MDGVGVEKSYEKAFDWAQKGAYLGDSNSMNALGFCYQNGLGVEVNYQKAINWYSESANLGNTNAKNNLDNLKSKL
jgi:TPR repeat protein